MSHAFTYFRKCSCTVLYWNRLTFSYAKSSFKRWDTDLNYNTSKTEFIILCVLTQVQTFMRENLIFFLILYSILHYFQVVLRVSTETKIYPLILRKTRITPYCKLQLHHKTVPNYDYHCNVHGDKKWEYFQWLVNYFGNVTDFLTFNFPFKTFLTKSSIQCISRLQINHLTKHNTGGTQVPWQKCIFW